MKCYVCGGTPPTATTADMAFINWVAEYKKNIAEMKKWLLIERIADANDLDATLEKGRAYLAYTIELLAAGEGFYIVKRAEQTAIVAADPQFKMLSTMLQKNIIEGNSAAQKAVFTELDRLNACITHSLDVWRSRLSFHKQELNTNGRQ